MTRKKLLLFYWLPIPFLLGFGVLSNRVLDINLHDTYFVVDHLTIFILISIMLFVSGLGYFLDSAQRSNKFLANIQFWQYFIGLSSFLLLSFLQLIVEWDGSRGEFVEYQNIDASMKLYLGQIASLAMVLMGFLVYLINMASVIVGKLKAS